MIEPDGFYWLASESNSFTEYAPFMVDGERNLALEWRWSCGGSAWNQRRFCDALRPHHESWSLDCRWVAVGVKETE